jgi:hypothetical protein
MADAPRITHSGGGTETQAARIADSLSSGIATALKDQRQPLHVDRLQLHLPAGASQAEIARAMARAIAQRRRP